MSSWPISPYSEHARACLGGVASVNAAADGKSIRERSARGAERRLWPRRVGVSAPKWLSEHLSESSATLLTTFGSFAALQADPLDTGD